jgi:transposase
VSDSDYEINYGYSKDGHPDMKQFLINLATTGKADIPFWFEMKDGNSSDKKTFGESAVEIVKKLKGQIGEAIAKIHVSDSAFYTAVNLKLMELMKWLSRVPETIKEAKSILENSNTIESWTRIDDNYSYSLCESNYAEIKQRWMIVFSKSAFLKEKTTFDERFIDKTEKLEKEIWHLENKIFESMKSAEEVVSKLKSKYKYYTIQIEKFDNVNTYTNKGRQKKDEKPIAVNFKVKLKYFPDKEKIQKAINCKGKFILATNELETNNLSDLEMLSEYKELQGTERGFRFLKDPWFMASDVYLKKESRIASLMMIMTLCLVVYNFTQYFVRSHLKDNNETLPNQLKKEVQNPTTRWIYQMMMLAAISIVRLPNPNGEYTEHVTNIKPTHKKIIAIFGKDALEIYGYK